MISLCPKHVRQVREGRGLNPNPYSRKKLSVAPPLPIRPGSMVAGNRAWCSLSASHDPGVLLTCSGVTEERFHLCGVLCLQLSIDPLNGSVGEVLSLPGQMVSCKCTFSPVHSQVTCRSLKGSQTDSMMQADLAGWMKESDWLRVELKLVETSSMASVMLNPEIYFLLKRVCFRG